MCGILKWILNQQYYDFVNQDAYGALTV